MSWTLIVPVFFQATSTTCLASTSNESTVIHSNIPSYPSSISLSIGVFHVPPYLYNIEESQEGPISASGFCPDMLERLQIFAEQDQVELTYQLKLAPPTYDGALDTVAIDCNTSSNPLPLENCQSFDVIASDYYYTAERAMRIDYSPVWLHGAISAVRYVPNSDNDSGSNSTANVAAGTDGEGDNVLSTYIDVNGDSQSKSTNAADSNSFITMAQASQEGQLVCLVAGTSIVPITLAKFPGANYVMCPDQQACLDRLKRGYCRLYVDDRLQLRYRAVSDPTLVVSSETFNPQYVTWIFNEGTLEPIQRRLLKRWLVAAHQNGTLGELYEKYFEKEPCPLGRAGPQCNLPCHAQHGRANAHGKCVCKSPKWTGRDCSIAVPEELNLIPQSLKALAFCLLGINGLVILGCGTWLFWNRKSQQVQMSQPSFLLLVLLGCAISSSTIIAMAQEPDASTSTGDAACMAIPWLYSLGFCVTFGTLFAKVRRVYIVFKSSAQLKRVTVSVLETLSIIVLVLLADSIILLSWTIVDPLKWQREVVSEDQFGEPLESQGYCTSEHWAAFAGAIAGLQIVLLLVASWMCFVSRHIATAFSEWKFVSIAIVSNLQILMVGVPVLIVVGADPAASFFVRSVVIWMNDLAVVILIFGHLIRSVHFGPAISVIKEDIRNAIQEFSKHQDDGMDHSWHSGIGGSESSVQSLGPMRPSKAFIERNNQPNLSTINAGWQAVHSSPAQAKRGSASSMTQDLTTPEGVESLQEEDQRRRPPNP